MKYIQLFENFIFQQPPPPNMDSSQAARISGFKPWGSSEDLAETLVKKREFENFYTNQFASLFGGAIKGIPKQGGAPLVVRNVQDFSKLMDAFNILKEAPQTVLDLSDTNDLTSFDEMKEVGPGFYVLRNYNDSYWRQLEKVRQASSGAIFILPEEAPMSSREIQEQIDLINLASKTMPQHDPNFFMFTK